MQRPIFLTQSKKEGKDVSTDSTLLIFIAFLAEAPATANDIATL